MLAYIFMHKCHLPVCPHFSQLFLNYLSHLHFYTGDSDTMIPLVWSTRTAASLLQRQFNVEHQIYPDVAHELDIEQV